MNRSPPCPLRQSARLACAVGLFLGLVGVLLGCSRGSFVGRQYDDFTAYYNTFHNANKAFEKGLESVRQSSESEVDRTRYISVFPDVQSSSGGSPFEKAIQKSADVLRQHPNSKWVDDALLLIGRSRYYQQNYVGAIQKFREVIALDGEREGEARFRLAKALLAADRQSEAEEALRRGLEQEADYGIWTARMQLVQGQLFVRQEEWTEAEEALAQGITGSLPDDLGARGALLLGQVRETLEDFEGAKVAYRRAAEYSPTYPLEFAARLGAVEMQGLSGDPEGALDRLESLKRGDDTNQMRGKIVLVRARLYRELGQPEKAKQILAAVLRGEEAPSGSVQGRIHYDLASLYRDEYEDFTRAAAHFDTAATNLSSEGPRASGTDRQSLTPPRVPTDASVQAERFLGLADRSETVARMDSLLRLGRMPPSEFRAVVERIRKKRLEEQQREARARRRREREQQFRPGGGGQAGERRDQSSASRQNAVQTRGSDAGFLFHRDPTLVQQGRRQFEQTWGDRPLVDNWRRVNTIQGTSAPTAAQEEGGQKEGQSGGRGRSESVVDVSAVPRDSASQAEMKKKRAVAQYELAMALFRAASRPDSAETWFRRVLEENEDHPVARQALYGLAQVHRAQGDSAAAEKAFRRIIERHPRTPYATRAREQLGMKRTEPVSTSQTSKADSVYARGYKLWQDGVLGPALNIFLTVAKTYPKTSAAPRALLAAGVAYHRSARDDSTGRFQAQFERFTDSLAQSRDGTQPESRTRADTTGEAPSATPRNRPSLDTTVVADRSQRASRQARPTPDTAKAPPDSVGQTAPDTTSRERRRGEGLPRRMVDSTAVAEQDLRSDRPDTTTAGPSVSPPDTTAPPEQKTVPDRVEGATNASPDSVRVDSTGRDAQQDPLRVLLAHLAERYSGTPEAKRAEKLLAYLEQMRAAADSTAPDSSASEPPSARESSPASKTVSTASDSAITSGAGPKSQVGSPDSTVSPQDQPPDTPRSEGSASTPTRPSDTNARAPLDSAATPKTSTGSPAPPDTSREE